MFAPIDLSRPTGHPRLKSLRGLAVIMLVIYLLVLAYFSLEPTPPGGGGNSDKVLHFIVYGGLTGLIAAAFPKQSLVSIFISVSLIGAGLEIAQGILSATRTASLADQLANMGGAFLALMIWAGFAIIRDRCQR